MRLRGFTLIELLLTVGILGILASIVIQAINPQKHINDAHDAQRRADLNAILNAVNQFQVGENGNLPNYLGIYPVSTIPEGEANKKDICILDDGYDCNADNKVFLYELIEKDYLKAIPQDPQNTDPAGSGYEIWRDADGRVHVRAPKYRNGQAELRFSR